MSLKAPTAEMPARLERVIVVLAVAAAAIVLLISVGLAVGQQSKATRTAIVEADDLVINLDKDTWEFTGKCRLNINAGHTAQMSAPRMSVQFSKKMDQILQLTAYGPVKFHVVTKANEEGIRRDISVSAQKQAVYREAAQTVEIIGAAEANITTVGVQGEAAHIVGDKITANLKTSQIFVDKPQMKIETPLED
jgi:hypothetical protein